MNQGEYETLKAKSVAEEILRGGRTAISSAEIASWPASAKCSNEEYSAIEIYEWLNEKPRKYFLYINETRREGTTWTGDRLGFVEFGREYRDNFGGTRVPISLHGTNGLEYHGTYFKSAGNYARIRARKVQS